MATRVTDFRIDTVDIAEGAYYQLPGEVRKLIEAYASPLRSPHAGIMRFEIPIYHWQEINAVMKRLTNAEF